MVSAIITICLLIFVLSDSNSCEGTSQGFNSNGATKISTNENHVFDSYFRLTDLEDIPNVCDDYESERCAQAWLREMDKVKKRNTNRLSNINYEYSTDITKRNGEIKLKFQQQNVEINRKLKEKVNKFKWTDFKSPKIMRIFKLLTSTSQSKNTTVNHQLLRISLDIGSIYNNARPCFGQCLEEGESGITNLFTNERNYDRLSGYWEAWRNVTGRRIKDLFIRRIDLLNVGARENGHSDAASFDLQDDFEENNFNETVLGLYHDILPLYQQLHAYVRHCLAEYYPGKFDRNGPIPAHILGNVWAQQWNNILPIIRNCRRQVSDYDIQKEVNLKLQHKSVEEIFEMAEEFYTSIDMFKMTPNFWERSVLKKRHNRLMNCHGSAHNFFNGFDFRIKMCTKKNINHFTTVHHEMGHIEYYMAYRQLPYALFGAANPGFHEAVGDTIALSVKTPTHLKRIGLIPEIPASEEFDLDYLMATALEKVAFLPFALTMDSYVWGVSNGSVPLDKLNQHWWDLRFRFQGLKPPIQRSETDFDPGAKYHIAFGNSYIRYFVSFIHQFQFYESMCDLSGYHGALHQCDFYQSKEAGRKLLEMLSKGKSQYWRDTIEILTGSRDISSRSLMSYFEPLYKWLKKTNEKLNIPIGW